jgi:hypothetical protein
MKTRFVARLLAALAAAVALLAGPGCRLHNGSRRPFDRS